MKIVGKNFAVDTRIDEKQLLFRDLKPGDVFSYLRGREENVYVKGITSIFLLTASREIKEEKDYSVTSNSGANSPVIVYPDAVLSLHEGVTLKLEAK